MRITSRLLVFPAMFTMLALAGNWSGKLLDAACYDSKKGANGCEATSQTTAFALSASGKVFKLDSAGNAKAAAAFKNRADRAEPGKAQAKEVMATITGQESGGTITVEAIEVQ